MRISIYGATCLALVVTRAACFAVLKSQRSGVSHAVAFPPTALWSTVTRYKGDLDSAALLAASTFPFKEKELINMAKEFLFVKKIGMADNGESFAEDFTFRTAFAEKNREVFVKTMGKFNFLECFGLKEQFFGWMVDPLQPNRVYFMNRLEAVQKKPFFGAEPTDKVLIFPPQHYHIDFNEAGKVTEFGFYTVDRAQGNTGGLGGAFGFFYGVGRPLPFPEGKPYKMSFQRFLIETMVKLTEKFEKKED